MAVTAISGLSAGVIPNTIEKTLLDGAIGDTFLKTKPWYCVGLKPVKSWQKRAAVS